MRPARPCDLTSPDLVATHRTGPAPSARNPDQKPGQAAGTVSGRTTSPVRQLKIRITRRSPEHDQPLSHRWIEAKTPAARRPNDQYAARRIPKNGTGPTLIGVQPASRAGRRDPHPVNRGSCGAKHCLPAEQEVARYADRASAPP